MSSLVFLREFVRDPVTLGAVAPSSPSLARLMVDAAAIGPGHVVVELGAGTGPMTAELVRRHPDHALMCLEPVGVLAAALRERFPDVRVEERYLQDLPELLAAWGHPRVDRFVSSLPWAIWTPEVQDACFAAILGSIQPDGRLVTFQYLHSTVLPAARRFRATLDRHFGAVSTTRVAWANLPPAFVFVCDQPRTGA